MRSCGKRSFTPACKTPRPRIGAEERGLKTGRFGDCRAAHFFAFQDFLFCGGAAFFAGVLAKKDVLVWCFCGEVVVIAW